MDDPHLFFLQRSLVDLYAQKHDARSQHSPNSELIHKRVLNMYSELLTLVKLYEGHKGKSCMGFMLGLGALACRTDPNQIEDEIGVTFRDF